MSAAAQPRGDGTRVHGADALAGGVPLGASRTFHGLDALRGLAAVVIVLFHAGFLYGVGRPPRGFLAVDLFFAMSGFIIAHRYDADLAAGMGLRAFARLRLVRLYPLFALGTLVGVLPSVLTLALQGPSATHLALVSALPSALMMLPSRAMLPDLKVLYPLNFVSWSLAFEVAANLSYAALFRRLTLPVLLAVAAAGFAGLCLCAACWGTPEVGFEWPHAVGGLARIAFVFPLGVALRRLTLAQPGAAGPRLRLPGVPWPVPLVAALALFCTPPLLGRISGGEALWSLAGCTLAVPLILAAAVAGDVPRRLHGLCALAGVYSYVLYSLHMPLVGLLLRAETRLHLDTARQGIGGALAFTVLAGTACLAAHHLYDKPVRRGLARGRPRRPAALAATAVAAES